MLATITGTKVHVRFIYKCYPETETVLRKNIVESINKDTMRKKKHNEKYIAEAEKRITAILNDREEFDDWTQFCFSMQDAVQAAATVWGRSTDVDIDKLNAFIQEMTLKEIRNVSQFDITFKRKEN